MRERGALPKEEGDAVREGRRRNLALRMKKKGERRGKGKSRKKRTKRRVLKEDVTVCFRWRPLKSSVKGETWRVAVVFLGVDLFDKSVFKHDTRVEVNVVLDVTDVLGSPSSLVTEFCDGFSCCSDWEFVLFFLQKACTLLHNHAGRDEV